MRLQPILLALGIMTALLGVAMIPCALVDIAAGRPEWPVFTSAAFGAVLVGTLIFILAGGRTPPRTGQREAFLLTVLVWVVLPGVAAVPFIASGFNVTDAVFESVSGLTTTGATVITGLDDRSPGLLLWRAILQWFGGIGIIVTALAIFPALGVGGMQLFQIESSDQSGKFLPRVTEIALQTGLVYLILSVLCAAAYLWSGMSAFDAVAHAMTTMAAGGFSTRDASFAAFEGTPAPYFAILFMVLAGLPFSLLVLAMIHQRPLPLFRDPQPRLFIALITLISGFVLLNLATTPPAGEAVAPIREVLFNVVSVITGTGYATGPYDEWGGPILTMFLITIFLGGCAGSAACGIKMFRLEISAKAIFAYAQRMVRPHRLVPVRYGGRAIDEDTLQSVMVFLFLYMATFLVAAALLGLSGEDPITAISGAATSVSNVGPGLGPVIGPEGSFQTLSPFGKWVCAIAMLLGRLEFVAVFVVLTRRFWRG